MKTHLGLLSLLWSFTATMEALPISDEHYSSLPREEARERDWTERNGRLLREQRTRRTRGYTSIVNHIWYAAVTDDSQTTSSRKQKCKLEDGTVVVVGEYHDSSQSKGKSSKGMSKGKSKSGSKGGKGSTDYPTENPTAMPTLSPTSATTDSPTLSPTNATNATSMPSSLPSTLPSPSPTECQRKGKSCKSSKSKKKKSKGSKSSMTMMSKSKSSKSSKSKGKSGKGKSSHDDIPYCFELTAAPGASPTASPTNSRNANPVTMAPTTADELERCNDIRDGTGNTTGTPDLTFKLFVLAESNSTLEDDFGDRLDDVMRAILALAAGCDDFVMTNATTQRRLRRLNSEPTAITTTGFTPTDMGGRSCTEAFGVPTTAPVCSSFDSIVETYGGNLTEEIILQMCTEYGPEAAEALSIENIQCVVDLLPFDVIVPTAAPTQSSTNFLAATESPTMDQGSRGTPGSTTRSGSDDTIDTGGWIALAAGILLLLSLCLCFCCNRRAKKDRDMKSYQNETFEQDDVSHANVTDQEEDGEAATSRSAVFVDPDMAPDTDMYAPADAAPTDEEEEYHVEKRNMSMGLYFDPVEQPSSDSAARDIELHERGEFCSSPTCRICEQRRQTGAKIPTMSGPGRSPPNEYPARGYIQDDTVEL